MSIHVVIARTGHPGVESLALPDGVDDGLDLADPGGGFLMGRISDRRRQFRRTSSARHYLLIAANIAVFLLLRISDRFTYAFSRCPRRSSAGRTW